MEGTRQITLLEPRPLGLVSGQQRFGEPRPHVVLAERKDSPSPGEGEIAPGVLGGEWRTTYTIREESVWPRPTEDWSLLDEHGEQVSLEGVFEQSTGARARRLVLVVERLSTGAPVAEPVG